MEQEEKKSLATFLSDDEVKVVWREDSNLDKPPKVGRGKILNYDDGVNFTSGLSFIRTSPCHGTAYDIVGKNIGNEKSLLNAIKLANLINKNRNNA